MYLIFDTETTNLPQDNLEIDHPSQARIIQLACILLDEKFKEISSLNTLLKIPEECQMHSKAYDKHRISKEYAQEYGIAQLEAIPVFMSFLRASKVVVGFGLEFDMKMIGIEYELLTGAKIFWEDKKLACLMKLSTPLVQLPFANGKLNKYGQKYKWPKLEEAFAFFSHELISNAHDAFSDTKSTAKILRYMIEDYNIIL